MLVSQGSGVMEGRMLMLVMIMEVSVSVSNGFRNMHHDGSSVLPSIQYTEASQND